jgi:hypothetical protein
MPIITRTEITAYGHCGQQLGEDGQPAFDHTGHARRPGTLPRILASTGPRDP